MRHAALRFERGSGWLMASALAVTSACHAERARDDFEPAPEASARPRTEAKVVPVSMPDALPPDQTPAAAQAVAAPASVKTTGKLGELLEGDVYYFKLVSVRPCDAAGKVAGVEVEIEAKARLAVSPRDVVIGKGGITFTSSMGFERKLAGCTPLLRHAALQKGQTARGFVLFDVPSRPDDDFTLVYQPTRWGGAGHVNVPLRGWSGPP